LCNSPLLNLDTECLLLKKQLLSVNYRMNAEDLDVCHYGLCISPLLNLDKDKEGLLMKKQLLLGDAENPLTAADL